VEQRNLPVDQLRQYIKHTWRQLVRDNQHLLQAAIDPKFPRQSDHWPVYVSHQENLARVKGILERDMPAEDAKRIDLRQLSANGAVPEDHGLLYLPYPYVVPGSEFNEMYGWDSYFIVIGLLRDGEIELAKNMVDNCLYQIEHYGKILNANRTYYLTRSHPPFLTGMILGVYQHSADRDWLRTTLPAIDTYYRFWTTSEPHLTPATGLSRYFDTGLGPVSEMLHWERDEAGRTHHERVQAHYRAQPDADYGYDLARFYDAGHDRLRDLFYVADRSMRESGYDVSDRFGRFNIGIIDYNPVCLSTLLYVMEQEMAQILGILGEHSAAVGWRAAAATRAESINHYMWNEAAGLYFDYDVYRQAQRQYPFGTAFFPLWAGLANVEQACRLVDNLPLLEAAGGLQASAQVSGCQWDAPFGWPPLQLIAVQGLRRYGYEHEADRISVKFLSLVLQEFIQHGTVFEKYDVVRRRSDTNSQDHFGYQRNVKGFGWTNGTFIDLLAMLPPALASIAKPNYSQ
jgi:alpha,alpha-trehalase